MFNDNLVGVDQVAVTTTYECETLPMTAASVLFLALAGIACVVDWVAVHREAKSLEYLAKPLATVLFLLAAVFIDADSGAPQAWRVAALAFCIAGDVFLMLPRDAFVPGLASFAIAQVLFTGSFIAQDPTTPRLLIGVLIAVPITAFLAHRFVSALKHAGHKDLVPPVVVYMVVISAMVVSALAGGTTAGVVGALLFMVSDSLIAETRFVQPRAWHGVAIMVTYHLALAGLVLGLG